MQPLEARRVLPGTLHSEHRGCWAQLPKNIKAQSPPSHLPPDVPRGLQGQRCRGQVGAGEALGTGAAAGPHQHSESRRWAEQGAPQEKAAQSRQSSVGTIVKAYIKLREQALLSHEAKKKRQFAEDPFHRAHSACSPSV